MFLSQAAEMMELNVMRCVDCGSLISLLRWLEALDADCHVCANSRI
jgi:hypothetical protein